MLSLSGHLGDLTAALVDGQLPSAQEERAWRHVLSCPGCRRAVEDEVLAKQRLQGYAAHAAVPAPPSWLRDLGPDEDGRVALAEVAHLDRHARRRTGVLAAGALATASLAAVVVATGTLGPLPGTGSGTTGVPGPASVGGVPAGAPAPEPGAGTVGTPTGSEVATPAVWVRTTR